MSARAARQAVRERLEDHRIAHRLHRMLVLHTPRSLRWAAAEMRRFRKRHRALGVGWLANLMRSKLDPQRRDEL